MNASIKVFLCLIACKVKPANPPAQPEIIRTCKGKVYRLDPGKTMEQTNSF